MWICMCDLMEIQRYLQIKIKMELVHSQFAFGNCPQCEYRSGCHSALFVFSLEYA
jgi:hypothetical protein